jgi:serine/threonine protein kinase
MPLAPGVRLGPYEIGTQIGAGGMGEVYRATDTNLKRTVAIKVLPDAFAFDGDRLARFQREAEVLASLNHPNIAQVYGLEGVDGGKALVMELVEGPTLADRIAQGPIPLVDALSIARQIAEGLEAAHEQGVIHRDLKLANIKVRPDGTVKVLDFGLAKGMEPVGIVSSNLSQSPTITTPAMTQAGVILGTAAYMSPEQARGQVVDRRTDIWAFGCVLYEMLTGRRAFAGETATEIVSEVLKAEPAWDRLPSNTPPPVRRLLRRCLRKDRKDRLHDIADARVEIDEARDVALGDGEQPLADTSRRKERIAWLALVALVFGAAAGTVFLAFRSRPAATEMHLEINTPAAVNPLSFAISPDGQKIVFTAR